MSKYGELRLDDLYAPVSFGGGGGGGGGGGNNSGGSGNDTGKVSVAGAVDGGVAGNIAVGGPGASMGGVAVGGPGAALGAGMGIAAGAAS